MNQNKALELTKDIATDIIGGILIAVGVYNFAAAAKFPMVGVNGIALIFYQLFGLPIGTVALKDASRSAQGAVPFLHIFFRTEPVAEKCYLSV